jgi:hypothetical protein
MRKALTLAICFGLSTGSVWADSFLMGGATRVQHNKSAPIFVATKSTTRRSSKRSFIIAPRLSSRHRFGAARRSRSTFAIEAHLTDAPA